MPGVGRRRSGWGKRPSRPSDQATSHLIQGILGLTPSRPGAILRRPAPPRPVGEPPPRPRGPVRGVGRPTCVSAESRRALDGRREVLTPRTRARPQTRVVRRPSFPFSSLGAKRPEVEAACAMPLPLYSAGTCHKGQGLGLSGPFKTSSSVPGRRNSKRGPFLRPLS